MRAHPKIARAARWGLVAAALCATVPAGAGSDPRFFGTYCGEQDLRECRRYRVCFFLGWPCVTRTRCETLEIRGIRARVGYREPAPGFGVIDGRGTARVRGRNLILNFGGGVIAPGLARGSMATNFFHPYRGVARLSPDGLGLSVSARGHTVTIRKDRCGNRAPRVAFLRPAPGSVVAYGRQVSLEGTVTDDEDASFPRERMRFRSNRDGPLGSGFKSGDRRSTLVTSRLSPGGHRITFTATDAGGLTAEATLAVDVVNRAPDPPEILQPRTGDTLVATGPFQLAGRGYDREDGLLAGSALSWAVAPGGGVFAALGAGRTLVRSIAEPGSYTLRLTAVDSLGAESSSLLPITVLPFTGNTPPTVRIDRPEHIEWRGIAVMTGDEMEFVGSVADAEDAIEDLTLEWTVQPTNPPGPVTVFGTGSTVATTVLSAVGSSTTELTITFRATDSGGLQAETSFKIVVLTSPII